MSTGYSSSRGDYYDSGSGSRRLAETSAQPSFSGSSSSLPAALGLGAPSPQPQQSSYANSTGHWTRYGAEAEPNERGSAHDRLGSSSGYSTRGAMTDVDSSSASNTHSTFTTLGSSDGYAGALEGNTDRRATSSSGIAGSAATGPSAPPRTFLVPVGATGARQKLNIMSASRRPRTSGAAERQHPSSNTKIDVSPTASALPRTASGPLMDAAQLDDLRRVAHHPYRTASLASNDASNGSSFAAGRAGASNASLRERHSADRRPSVASSTGLSATHSQESSAETPSPRWDAPSHSMYNQASEASSNSSFTDYGVRPRSRSGSMKDGLSSFLRTGRTPTPTQERSDTLFAARGRNGSVSSVVSDQFLMGKGPESTMMIGGQSMPGEKNRALGQSSSATSLQQRGSKAGHTQASRGSESKAAYLLGLGSPAPEPVTSPNLGESGMSKFGKGTVRGLKNMFGSKPKDRAPSTAELSPSLQMNPPSRYEASTEARMGLGFTPPRQTANPSFRQYDQESQAMQYSGWAVQGRTQTDVSPTRDARPPRENNSTQGNGNGHRERRPSEPQSLASEGDQSSASTDAFDAQERSNDDVQHPTYEHAPTLELSLPVGGGLFGDSLGATGDSSSSSPATSRRNASSNGGRSGSSGLIGSPLTASLPGATNGVEAVPSSVGAARSASGRNRQNDDGDATFDTSRDSIRSDRWSGVPPGLAPGAKLKADSADSSADHKSLPPTPMTSAPSTPPARPMDADRAASFASRSAETSRAYRMDANRGLSTVDDNPTEMSFDTISVNNRRLSEAPSAAPSSKRGSVDQTFSARSSSVLSSSSPTPTSSRGPLLPPGPVSSNFQSPLLASLASVAVRSSTPTGSASASPAKNPLNTTPPSTMSPSRSEREVSVTSLAIAPNDESSGIEATARSPRPNIPARSRDRPSTLQPDPATLSRLEGTSKPVALESQDSQTETSSEQPKKPSVDAATFVPAGALTHTRHGVPVKSSAGAAAAAAARAELDAKRARAAQRNSSAMDDVTPRGSIDRSRMARTSPILTRPAQLPMTSPIQSRFSLASSATSPSVPDSTDSDGQVISFNSRDFDIEGDDGSLEDSSSMLPTSAWTEVDTALQRFKEGTSPSGAAVDKGGLLRSVLLPFLALEAETPNVEVSGDGPFRSAKARRSLFFEWIRYLLLELQHVQTSTDRGAILESIACIIESRNFSVGMLADDKEDDSRFSSVFGHILSYAIGELNKKGVYQNTLIFSGRLLAVAFFRVTGVASKLLRALPVNRFALERVAAEANWDQNQPLEWEQYQSRFPESLQAFCYQDARSYLRVLDAQTAMTDGDTAENEDDRYLVRQPEVEVEMSGNWLRRWQSDDSELFFSFCRSYHRQLAGLMSLQKAFNKTGSRLFFGGPGYAHLATCVHQKCLSLVHRDILSVTTLSSQKNFNPGETANVLSGSTAGKPRHLEAANRRCTAIVVDIVRAPSINNQVFGPMLGVHVKCLVKRTSLYDVQSVFCLLDWLDGVLSHIDSAELHTESLVDVSFVIEMIQMLLRDADHALALMRTIAFSYSNFAVLSSTMKNRTRFCEEILLDRRIFEKLFLSWSFTIRAYFLHLLVFRLARINDFSHPKDDPHGKAAVSIARLFNQRLDEIRRRHDELSPAVSTDASSDADERSAEDQEDDAIASSLQKSRNRPASFVSTIRHTPSIRGVEASNTAKAERILGIGMPDPILAPKGEPKAQSRAAKWLRALGGKSSVRTSKNKGGFATSPLPAVLESPTITNEPRNRTPRFDELDFLGEEDEDDEDDASSTGSGAIDKNVLGNKSVGLDDDLALTSAVNNKSGSEFSFQARPMQDSTDRTQPASSGGNIAPDMSFDLQSPTSPHPPPGASLLNGRASPRHGTSSPRVSRAFSRRSSILPGPALDLVAQDDQPPVPPIPEHLRQGYAKSLHIYAIQSLREYEQTVQEHDEFFAAQADAANPQVPRLPISWPAMWSSE
ncbi:hypothetical protein IE81DRAFT_324413 [Ceraceosorus guamensis]|uniref:Uncharacterized protein n=1 Tax=Ceraceosorus guamensis TaxID=1522189 RepID=A0A316VW80_9BASI|nr:hypothetical protein IE81DRAFT_324413 [Ceraceosorus guamensis]PWN41554.1 hypothetical protein IE81DRAFT_324413 [Ceraceosorus guamensis]